MNQDRKEFLSLLGLPPVRLTVEQTAFLLNCQPHDVPILVASRLIKPLGNPGQNSIKFFATADVLELSKERSWLMKVTSTINQHWHRKNVRQKSRLLNAVEATSELSGDAAH